MLLLRREKIVFPNFAGSPEAAERTHNSAHHGEEVQTNPKRNPWRFRRLKEDGSAGKERLKKSRTNREDREESEDGGSGGEGEHADSDDELEREMEDESEVDVDVDKEGVSFRMKETRRPHLKMVRQRHKQESHAGS